MRVCSDPGIDKNWTFFNRLIFEKYWAYLLFECYLVIIILAAKQKILDEQLSKLQIGGTSRAYNNNHKSPHSFPAIAIFIKNKIATYSKSPSPQSNQQILIAHTKATKWNPTRATNQNNLSSWNKSSITSLTTSLITKLSWEKKSLSWNKESLRSSKKTLSWNKESMRSSKNRLGWEKKTLSWNNNWPCSEQNKKVNMKI